jgi:hypothetical protein
LEDRDVVFIMMWLDLGMLFSLCASASSFFEAYTVLFVEYVVAEFGEGGARGCVIGFLVTGLIGGGGRGLHLWGKEVVSCHGFFVNSSSICRNHGGCHGRREGGTRRTLRRPLWSRSVGDTDARPRS